VEADDARPEPVAAQQVALPQPQAFVPKVWPQHSALPALVGGDGQLALHRLPSPADAAQGLADGAEAEHNHRRHHQARREDAGALEESILG
jgi:hypothetical protein